MVSESALAKAPPNFKVILNGLESWHFLNDSLEKAARNYAPGKPNAAIVGEPVVSGNYTTFKGLANYLQTDWLEGPEATIFIVAKTDDTLVSNATRPMYVGTFRNPPADGLTGGTAHGVSITHDVDGSLAGYAARGTNLTNVSSYPAKVTVPNFNAWALYSLTVAEAAGNNTTIRDHTRNSSGGIATTAPMRYSSIGKYRIGSGFQTYGGNCDMAIEVGYSRALTVAEIDATVANIRAYMARRGIAV